MNILISALHVLFPSREKSLCENGGIFSEIPTLTRILPTHTIMTPKSKHTPKIEESVWDFKKITKDIYIEPEIIEEFDTDNDDPTYTGYCGFNGYPWGD